MWGNTYGAPDFWLQSGAAPATAAIWGVTQSREVSLPLEVDTHLHVCVRRGNTIFPIWRAENHRAGLSAIPVCAKQGVFPPDTGNSNTARDTHTHTEHKSGFARLNAMPAGVCQACHNSSMDIHRLEPRAGSEGPAGVCHTLGWKGRSCWAVLQFS